jgi:inward rectifier potassium channel
MQSRRRQKQLEPTEGGGPKGSLARSIASSDHPDIIRIGHDRNPLRDLYFSLTHMSWVAFSLLFFVCFLAINCFFAGLYLLDPSGLSPTSDLPAFWKAFFFSIHTIATVGYGNIYPVSMAANIIVAGEICIGFLFFALTSGIVFSRFSRPNARILFSNKAVVTNFKGVPTLMFRAANQRNNFILEASVTCSVLRGEIANGRQMRRFHELRLVQARTPVFALSWQIMHPIDDKSPLHGMDEKKFNESDDEIIVLLSGTDASVSQPIHGRMAYQRKDIFWDFEFEDVLTLDKNGVRVINYRKFHDIVPVK